MHPLYGKSIFGAKMGNKYLYSKHFSSICKVHLNGKSTIVKRVARVYIDAFHLMWIIKDICAIPTILESNSLYKCFL